VCGYFRAGFLVLSNVISLPIFVRWLTVYVFIFRICSWSRSNPQKNVQSEILCGHIKKEREAAKARKRPCYLKKCLFLNPITPSSRPCFSAYLYFIFVCCPAEIRRRKLMDKYNELKVTHSWFMWLLIFHTYGHLWPYASVHAVHLQEMESLMLLWRSEGRRMPPKIIVTCHTKRTGVVYFYHFVAVLMSEMFTSNQE
jgi:hypothetical protein